MGAQRLHGVHAFVLTRACICAAMRVILSVLHCRLQAPPPECVAMHFAAELLRTMQHLHAGGWADGESLRAPHNSSGTGCLLCLHQIPEAPALPSSVLTMQLLAWSLE